MYLKSLYLRNFRNYSEAEVTLTPGLNVFFGDNAQGKTNLLEAIYLLATGRSFRTQHLNELIRSGESFFYLEAQIVRDNVSQRIKITFDGQNRQLQMDGNEYKSFHPLLGLMPCVLHTPYDIELISGSPTERRRFLNLHLAQSDPLYVHHLTRYWRAMKQRNCLLRTKDPTHLEPWEIEMAKSATYLQKVRQEMIAELSLDGGNEIRFSPSQCDLKKNRIREMELGLTLTGPHRDELSLIIDGKPARLFASEGQKKTLIASLKLAEWQRLKNRIGDTPLMGIDDFGMHLDETRQARLKGKLNELGQVFLTTPFTPTEGHAIHIAQGKVHSF